MRYTAEHKAETHERIVRRAAAEFRARGLDGVGVAEIMKQAGLTHGGFYAHFESKDALYEEALDAAFKDSWTQLLARVQRAPASQRAQLIAEAYLSVQHRDRPERGCALPALGGEIARQSPALRARCSAGVEKLAELIQDEAADRDARPQALAQIAAMVGAMVLARAVDSEALSDEILQAVKAKFR